jgi:hypothetical protein
MKPKHYFLLGIALCILLSMFSSCGIIHPAQKYGCKDSENYVGYGPGGYGNGRGR